MADCTTGAGFVKLPRAVLNDPHLSAEAKIGYAVLVDAADRDDRSSVRISNANLGRRVGRSRDTGRRIVAELIAAGHITVAQSPIGWSRTYSLTHSTDATGTVEEPMAPVPPTHSTDAMGTHSTGATQRKRTLDGSFLNNVRGLEKKSTRTAATELGDALLEVLLDLGWPARKIRRESAILHRQIGGAANERVFISEIQQARANPSIENPVAFALARFRRQGAATGAPAA